MSQWREEALAQLPELGAVIGGALNVMSLWIELHLRLAAAYDARPIDEETIRRIYRYALWTIEASADDDAITAVVVAFFEHLPTHPAVREDLHRWIQPGLFNELESAFGYFLSPAELEAFQVQYRQRRAAWLG